MTKQVDLDYDLAVIGAGPGGYTAAISAAQKGLKVVLIEGHQRLGGTCLNVGCIPSKALIESSALYHKIIYQSSEYGVNVSQVAPDWEMMQERKNGIVQKLTQGISALMGKNKVEVMHGWAQLISPNEIEISLDDQLQIISAHSILLAPGSVPVELPFAKCDGINVLNSTQILSIEEVPESLCIIGAGVIGLEMASVFSSLGTKISIVEAQSSFLSQFDTDVSEFLEKKFRTLGWEFHFNAKVSHISEKNDGKRSVIFINSEGKKKTVICSHVLSVVGRKPNTDKLNLDGLGIKKDDKGFIKVDVYGRTSMKNIWAIGDATGQPMLAHKAEEEGKTVVESLVDGYKYPLNARIPSIIYTHPEVAMIGESEEELKQRGCEYKKGKFPFSASGRALSSGNTEGFVKILVESQNNEILGASIAGEHASELIAEIGLAMNYNASAEDITRTCHAHPTLSEVVKEACSLAYSGKTINF